MKKRLLLLGLAVAVAGGGGWWWRVARQRAELRAELPPPPDLTGWPRVLKEKLSAAANGSVAGLEELSRLYHANGFYRQALPCYELLEKLEPAEPRWPHRHATILAGYGEAEPALALWRRVLRLAPDYLPARLRLGELLLKSNRPDDAAAVYQDILHRQPDESYALLGLARLDIEAGRWEDARARLEKLVAKTNYTLGYDLIVTVYEHFGQREAAEEVRARAKASGAYRDPPDPWVDELIDDCYEPYRLSTVAGFATSRGDLATADRLLRRALALAPDDAMLSFQFGSVLVAEGQLAPALDQLQRCTILAPNFSDGWAQLSDLQARLGSPEAAAQALASGLRQCPDSPALHLLLARRLRGAGRLGEAIAEYRTSIRLRPNEPDAYIELGNILIGQNRVDEGIEDLKKALDVEPGNPVALIALAYYAIASGNESDARQWLRRIARQPRIEASRVAQLTAAYHQQFGHAWVP
ncbi:MAG TPA: tetratricopeptide repeat protein [Opitutaceae bacterium]|nr:tetratricopeptide repeat protein [Opitutaceae bacterium]